MLWQYCIAETICGHSRILKTGLALCEEDGRRLAEARAEEGVQKEAAVCGGGYLLEDPLCTD